MGQATIIPFKRSEKNSLTCFSLKESAQAIQCPLYESRVAAGFPSPASDYMAHALDLNKLLIKNPAATFFVRVNNDSLSDQGIFEGDIAIVDRSLLPRSGNTVIIVIEGEAVMRRFGVETRMNPQSYSSPSSLGTTPDGLEIWGVVTHVIHKV